MSQSKPAPIATQEAEGRMPSAPAAARQRQIEWRSEELFRDQREVLIRHGEELYRLRITRQGKLILNK